MAILYKLKETVAPVLHPVPRHGTPPCHFASRAAAQGCHSVGSSSGACVDVFNKKSRGHRKAPVLTGHASPRAIFLAGGIEAIVFHDKMKGCYKDLVRKLGAHYDVPIYKHQRLRNPETMEFRKSK